MNNQINQDVLELLNLADRVREMGAHAAVSCRFSPATGAVVTSHCYRINSDGNQLMQIGHACAENAAYSIGILSHDYRKRIEAQKQNLLAALASLQPQRILQ